MNLTRCRIFFIIIYCARYFLEGWDIWVSLRSKCCGEIKIKKRQQLGEGSYNTGANNQDLSLKNAVDIWTVLRETCVICVIALLFCFDVGSILGVVFFYLILTLSSQFLPSILRETFLGMPWGTRSRLLHKI